MTRATSHTIPNPDDPTKVVTKKMYYMACGFCRWTTRDVNLPDQTVGKSCVKLCELKVILNAILFIHWNVIIPSRSDLLVCLLSSMIRYDRYNCIMPVINYFNLPFKAGVWTFPPKIGPTIASLSLCLEGIESEKTKLG